MKTLPNSDGLVFSPPQPGCVLYLPGLPGGDSKAYDRSPYGNNGTITGATWKRLPSGLWCLSFDGVDDKVNCGHHSSFDLTSTLTIKAWVNITDPAGANYESIFGKMGGTIGGSAWLFLVHSGALRFDILNNTGDDRMIASAAITTGWKQLIGTYDLTGTARLYINGVEEGTDTTVTTAGIKVEASDDVMLGENIATYDYRGGVALAELTSRVWSALEVQNIYNREKHLFGVW